MSEPSEPVAEVENARAVPRRRHAFGWIWLVPLIAVGLALWVAWDAYRARGPTVEVTFETAAGVEEGRTKLRYRDIEVGTVERVKIGDDLRHVIVSIRLVAEASRLLSSSSRFWVVRPRIGSGQISGLETVVSGAYIDVDPGTGGEPASRFTGLENPPRVRSDTTGQSYVLRVQDLQGLDAGTPLLFKGVQVGEITDIDPPKLGTDLTLHVFVEAPYDQLVRESSRFWRVSALSLGLDTGGFNVSVGNLTTLLRGGVAFDSPPEGKHAPDNTSFALFDDSREVAQQSYTEHLPMISFFDGSVRGLSPGAPVEVRGIRIGTVRSVSLEFDVKTGQMRIPVQYQIEPERVSISGDEDHADAHTLLSRLVNRGLRAQLRPGNLLTGEVLVSLDFFPDAAPQTLGNDGDTLIMPTVPASIDSLERSVTGILDKVAQLPIEDLVTQLRATVASIENIADSAELKQSLTSLNALLGNLNGIASGLSATSGPVLDNVQRAARDIAEAARSANDAIGPRSDTRLQLNNVLREFALASRSIRTLADYLERHPDALLRGKTAGGR